MVKTPDRFDPTQTVQTPETERDAGTAARTPAPAAAAPKGVDLPKASRPRRRVTVRRLTEHPQFYLTAPSPCPYLPGRMERKVFTHLVGNRAEGLNDLLTQSGFRRSQNIAYRPSCEGCRGCISVRVRVDDFQWTKSLKRVLRNHAALERKERPALPSSEQYSVFRAYLDSRHAEGGMADMTVLDYAMMVEDTHVETRIFEYREPGTRRSRGDLLACALTDILADGLSMVYSFYEPEAESTGLGTFMILDHIERAQALDLPYVYLGYWVDGSDKMAYKARFQPQEHLTSKGWITVPPS